MNRRRVHRASVGARERALRTQTAKQVAGLLLFATLLGIVYVWTRVQVIDLRYELRTVQKRVNELHKEIAQAESHVATLKSADRLSRIGRERLGLRNPQAGQLVVVQGGEQ